MYVPVNWELVVPVTDQLEDGVLLGEEVVGVGVCDWRLTHRGLRIWMLNQDVPGDWPVLVAFATCLRALDPLPLVFDIADLDVIVTPGLTTTGVEWYK